MLNFKYFKVLSLCFLISLVSAIHGTDKTQELNYSQPNQPYRMNIITSTIVGLSLMLSPTPAQAVSEFGGCYLMTAKGVGMGSPSSYAISQIRTSGCDSGYEPFLPHGPIRSITNSPSFTLSVSPLRNRASNVITSVSLCNTSLYDINYDSLIDIGFNISGNNCYYDNSCKDGFLMNIEKSGINRGKQNIIFDNIFAKFMNTGSCPGITYPK